MRRKWKLVSVAELSVYDHGYRERWRDYPSLRRRTPVSTNEIEDVIIVYYESIKRKIKIRCIGVSV